MTSSARINYVNESKFTDLFVEELGWNRPALPAQTVEVDDVAYPVEEVANYVGIRVWLCRLVPDARTQRLIDAEVRKLSTERLLIFASTDRQEWRWLQSPDSNGSGQPRLVTHRHSVGNGNLALDQRLEAIRIGLAESPSLIEMLRRMRSAFDADVVTKRFYDQFIKKQQMLTNSIEGIADEADRDWYAALIMNRLMFIYFMQKKGFMDGDRDYLRNRLTKTQELVGTEKFYVFYRDFLLPMFHTGLGTAEEFRSYTDELIKGLVGKVPYINGGIFSEHPLEESNSISIPDSIFASVFQLFDRFQWHLDDRPNVEGDEINPDVLGYIFEQFVNQKESQDDKGAYYTKGDVTHFMVSASLIPVFFERVESKVGISPWALLQASPEKYVWRSLAWGIDDDFPAEIEQERSQSARPSWAGLATEDIGLPSETWWEADHRIRQYRSLVEQIASGRVTTVDEAVTANLDLETLAIDLIDTIDDGATALSVWGVLSELKVIDPTCGSGAFLFAALRILEPLYNVTMEALRRHGDAVGVQQHLATVEGHANEDYFVLKHATLSNIFGVDIMREAVEIARLRLFLKLVSTIDRFDDLEPLPDLDFNIKAGNALVGAAHEDDFDRATEGDLFFSDSQIGEVKESAGLIAAAFNVYRDAQQSDGADVKAMRQELTDLLAAARPKADQLYKEAAQFDGYLTDWQESHRPFHWYLEFPGVFADGGFDVVIGNPPYVTKSNVGYSYRGFETDALPDIYAPCCERAAKITRPDGRLALIVPISSQFGDRYEVLRSVYSKRFSSIWVSAFQERPSALFQVKVRSSIIIAGGEPSATPAQVHTTLTHSWVEAYRPHLLATLKYVERPVSTRTPNWMRASDESVFALFDRMILRGNAEASVVKLSEFWVGWKKTATYFLTAYSVAPTTYDSRTQAEVPLNQGQLHTQSRADQLALAAVLASKMAFLWWTFTGDCFNVTRTTMASFPFSLRACDKATYDALVTIGEELEAALPAAEVWDMNSGKFVGGYMMPSLRSITDRADALMLASLGQSELLPEVEYAHARMFKSTGESSTLVRSLPFRTRESGS